jgi:hypothetical protein
MRWNRLTTLLLSSAALLAAGAAGAQAPPESNLLTGAFKTVDEKNPLATANARVMPLGDNDDPSPSAVEIDGECLAGGERVLFRFEAGLIDKSKITDKTAQLDQKHKENPAEVFGVLPGTCDDFAVNAGASCFDGDECESDSDPGECDESNKECTLPAGNAGDPCTANKDCDTVVDRDDGVCSTVPRCTAPAEKSGDECVLDVDCDRGGHCGSSCSAPDVSLGDDCVEDAECNADPANDGVCVGVLCTAPPENVGMGCISDADCNSPPGLCEGSSPPEVPLLCGKAKVNSKVQTGKDGKFKGNASKCTASSVSLVAATEIACPGAKNIKVTTKGTVVEKVKISGNGPTAEVSP